MSELQRQLDELKARVRELEQIVRMQHIADRGRTGWIRGGGGVGGEGVLARTPVGGIAAMVANGANNWTPGTETCTSIVDNGNDIQTAASAVDLFNVAAFPIPGNAIVQAKKIGEKLIVDFANCEPIT